MFKKISSYNLFSSNVILLSNNDYYKKRNNNNIVAFFITYFKFITTNIFGFSK